jgi:PPK2 family polyphosphate:nucleotide phosphotransferase
MSAVIKTLQVEPGAASKLQRRDPAATPEAPGDEQATVAATAGLIAGLQVFQERLYAEHRRSVLIVLQGLDCSGKDGTIRHVIRGLNPAGVEVVLFKQPSEVELAHDFLWRIHPHAPAIGHIAVFNRSHYEDVTAVRVRALAPANVWRERFDHINAFERLLAHRDTTIVKFFLHISRHEQAKRMRERAADPRKRWKLTPEDLVGHEQFDEYLAAYEEALTRTSTEVAPWYAIPSDHKWYRNWAIAHTLLDVLRELDPKPPDLPVPEGLDHLS